jgi:hypothetical protein
VEADLKAAVRDFCLAYEQQVRTKKTFTEEL